jgi:hypothetical protein
MDSPSTHSATDYGMCAVLLSVNQISSDIITMCAPLPIQKLPFFVNRSLACEQRANADLR